LRPAFVCCVLSSCQMLVPEHSKLTGTFLTGCCFAPLLCCRWRLFWLSFIHGLGLNAVKPNRRFGSLTAGRGSAGEALHAAGDVHIRGADPGRGASSRLLGKRRCSRRTWDPSNDYIHCTRSVFLEAAARRHDAHGSTGALHRHPEIRTRPTQHRASAQHGDRMADGGNPVQNPIGLCCVGA
jgi:hypothetical protein